MAFVGTDMYGIIKLGYQGGRYMPRLPVLCILFGFLSAVHAQEQGSHAYIFDNLYSRVCNKSCTLDPDPGEPFSIEYKIRQEEEGGKHFVDLKLDGTAISSLNIFLNFLDDPLPFHQMAYFPDHRFQIYSLVAHTHASTSYDHYFIRDKNGFHYLGYFPSISYDYNAKEKKENEKFYADVGVGEGKYIRQHYKLDGARFVETTSELIGDNDTVL